MFFSIEFIKIVKRKFNYSYLLLVMLIVALLSLKLSDIAQFYSLTNEVAFVNIICRFLLVLVMFIMMLNFIFSYRQDYKTKVVSLLKLNKKETKKSIVAVVVSSLYFLFYYLLTVTVGVAVLYFRNRDMLRALAVNFKYNVVVYIAIVFLLLVFANLIFLLILSVFNDTNLAISLSLLYFIGSAPLSTFLANKGVASKYLDNSLNIVTTVFDNLTQTITYNNMLFLSLVANIVIVFVLVLVIRIIKR